MSTQIEKFQQDELITARLLPFVHITVLELVSICFKICLDGQIAYIHMW